MRNMPLYRLHLRIKWTAKMVFSKLHKTGCDCLCCRIRQAGPYWWNKGASLKDTIEVTALFTLLILPFLLAKLWWWFWFFVIVLGIFGATEVYLDIFKNTTLTKMFRKYRKEHPKQGLMILISMMLGWLVLLFHLL